MVNHADDFVIAGHRIRMSFEQEANGTWLIPSLNHFKVQHSDSEEPLLSITVDDSLRPVPKPQRERIGKFDTGNGDIVVDRLPDGGYQYIMKDLQNYDVALIISNKSFSNCRVALNGNLRMRAYGLNGAVMMAFAYASAMRQTLLIHASLVRKEGRGYAFIAKSGTGKSTQVSNWLRYIPGCDLMNDDNPIVRIIDGEPWIFGSPWSGKTPCYRNVKARLGAITRIDRAKTNSIERLKPLQAFTSLLPSCSSMKWDEDIYNAVCDTVTRIVETSKLYILHCLPDEASALLCYKNISK